MMRRGGTATMDAERLDETIDFLAARITTGVGATESVASLNCLSSNFDEAFGLFLDIVRNPRFQADRLELDRTERLEAMKQRNDSADAILAREWSALLYGEDHFGGRFVAADHVEGTTADDLRALHARIFHPGNLVISAFGDFDPEEMTARLRSALADWAVGPAAPPPPAPVAELAPGVYHVEKDIPQGKVFIGLRGIEREDEDFFPMLLMNNILGGSGFTSRITKRVRSDEGLAYTARSLNRAGTHYPGEFRAVFQSKNRTVALATKLVFEEFDRIRAEDVSAEELEVAKNSIISTFPRRFESRPGTLSVFVDDYITGRPDGYWEAFRDRVREVTAEDIRAVANRRLSPEAMAIFVVGAWDEIYAGDLEGRASMSEFFNGDVTHVPLRDPMTMEATPGG